MSSRVTPLSKIGRTLGVGFDRRVIASTALLSVISLFYLYFVGSFFEITIYPLVNRVTDNRAFDFALFTRELDEAILGFSTVCWLVLSVPHGKKLLLLLAIYGSVAVYSYVTMLVEVVGGDSLLALTALSSIPLIILVLVHNRVFGLRTQASHKGVVFNFQLYGSHLTIILLGLALVSLIHAIARFAFFSSTGDTSAIDTWYGMPVRNYGHEVFLLTSSISPLLVLMLSASFGTRFLIRELRRLRGANVSDDLAILEKEPQPGSWSAARSSSAKEGKVPRPLKLVGLGGAVSLSLLVVLLPHIPSVNPEARLIGVDTPYYSSWQAQLLESQTTTEILNRVFVEQAGGDRPLFLLVQFGAVKVWSDLAGNKVVSSSNTESLPYFIEYFMTVVGSVLVITSYFLTREITRSDAASLLAAIISAFSFQMLIGIYAGFYANVLALSFGYLSFLFMFKLLRNPGLRSVYVAGFVIFFVMLYLTHAYTWTIFALVMAMLLAILFFAERRVMRGIASASTGLTREKLRTMLVISIVLVSVLVVDIGRSALGGTQSGIGRDLLLAQTSAGTAQFLSRWENIENTIFVFGGGIFSNIIILGLGVYWLFRPDLELLETVFLMAFLATGIIPLLFGDWILQSRVLFNIPFHIPAGIALFAVLARAKSVGFILTLALCIWLAAESMISISNFPPLN